MREEARIGSEVEPAGGQDCCVEAPRRRSRGTARCPIEPARSWPRRCRRCRRGSRCPPAKAPVEGRRGRNRRRRRRQGGPWRPNYDGSLVAPSRTARTRHRGGRREPAMPGPPHQGGVPPCKPETEQGGAVGSPRRTAAAGPKRRSRGRNLRDRAARRADRRGVRFEADPAPRRGPARAGAAAGAYRLAGSRRRYHGQLSGYEEAVALGADLQRIKPDVYHAIDLRLPGRSAVPAGRHPPRPDSLGVGRTPDAGGKAAILARQAPAQAS